MTVFVDFDRHDASLPPDQRQHDERPRPDQGYDIDVVDAVGGRRPEKSDRQTTRDLREHAGSGANPPMRVPHLAQRRLDGLTDVSADVAAWDMRTSALVPARGVGDAVIDLLRHGETNASENTARMFARILVTGAPWALSLTENKT